MEMAEFLNLETKQVQWLDASLRHPNLVRVPDEAEIYSFHKIDKKYSFYKGDASFVMIGDSGDWVESEWTNKELIDTKYINIIWQRTTPLRQAVDNAKQKTGMKERELSKAIGREESYITKMFSDKRNPKSATVEKLIEDLEALGNKPVVKNEAVKILTVELSIDTKEVQDELKKVYALVDQANQNSELNLDKADFYRNIAFIFSIVIVALVFILMGVILIK